MRPGEIGETRRSEIPDEKKRLFLLLLPSGKGSQHLLIGHCRQFDELGRLALFFFAPRRLGQHRADDGLDRREVEVGNPLRQLQQPLGQERILGNNTEDGLQPILESVCIDFLNRSDRPDSITVAKGNPDPLT